ncbi:conserved Plasmodium protein, unknown function [Plasmodium gallinaceum]|uniref:FHA domain-containing protein n=1 Tax=Plasmodium gallinaceum TaxID=5849 RepID=A0A1J1GLG5_PLAGA|nr:conserved Plasmodium protein, unknown function [Plasmodium gallinaceum]CRG93246.1 conserved Plasmodium protein, unknown function [Plasmodium gallinaceum]
MDCIENNSNNIKTNFNTDDDFFDLFKNCDTLVNYKKKVEIKSLNDLIHIFVHDKERIYDEYKPCEAFEENSKNEEEISEKDEFYTKEKDEKGKLNENVKDEHKKSLLFRKSDEIKEVAMNDKSKTNLKNVGLDVSKDCGSTYPICINENYNEILYLSKKNVSEDCIHLKKIQKICNDIKNNLKFYKVENHDKYKFRPRDINKNLIKKKRDSYNTEYTNYNICGKDSEKNYLRDIEKRCKEVVQYLNFNCDLVDINEVIDILNIITNPDFDERIDKYKYLKLFITNYHYVYPSEDIDRLRKIRKYVRSNYIHKGDFYINENDISDIYLKTNLDKIYRNEIFVNNMLNLHIDNGKFWIQLVHNIWIPLTIENLNSLQNSFYSYLFNYDNDVAVLDQFTYSRRDRKFYKFSHYIFTGILFSGIPSIYRLLMRLCTYKYCEVRINMILEKNYDNIYNDIVISSLNYHIDAIRNFFPFFKEYKNINMENIVENFFDSSFFSIIISSLKKNNIERVVLNQKYLNFINSFFLMITEFLYGISSKKCLEKINDSQINLLECFDNIFYDDMNILIGRDILLFTADLLCLYKLNSIYIKRKHCNIILKMTNLIKNAYYIKDPLTNNDTWKQTYVVAVKINHFIKCALERKQTINDNIMLQELTLINRFYFNDLKQENSIGEFYCLKNINYGIYCWNSVCNKYTNIHHYEYNKNNFEYCQGCYIATYCSEQCRLTHLLSSHHNVCVYFKRIPSFLKFNTFNVDFNFYDMKYLNIFQNIDIFDKENDKYHVIY